MQATENHFVISRQQNVRSSQNLNHERIQCVTSSSESLRSRYHHLMTNGSTFRNLIENYGHFSYFGRFQKIFIEFWVPISWRIKVVWKRCRYEKCFKIWQVFQNFHKNDVGCRQHLKNSKSKFWDFLKFPKYFRPNCRKLSKFRLFGTFRPHFCKVQKY